MPQPHILLILIDDLGWADLGCFGSSFYETPHLDRLADQGMRFTDAYASCPVCSPTRASLMTGRYPARVGITNYIPGNAWGKLMGVPYFHELPRSERTLPQCLGDAGYATYHVGKWHLGGPATDQMPSHLPTDFGFDENVAGWNFGYPRGGYFSPYDNPALEDGPEGEYLTDRLTDEAIARMKRHASGGDRSDQPFFVHLSHYAVHTPIQAPADLVAKYEQKARDMGIDQDAVIEEGECFTGLHKKDQRVKRRTVQSHPTYAAMMENLDTNIGRAMDALDELGLAEDTIVIFTADNGGLSTAEGSPTCNAPLSEGKGWMYDGGNRVSQIIRWPAVVEPGQTSGVPTTTPDLFSTCLDVAGASEPADRTIDGVSLQPLLRGDAGFQRDPIYWHYPHYSNQGGSPTCSIRNGSLKLIEHFEDGKLELFDLSQDIGESRNLADEEPDQRDRLKGLLDDWKRDVEAQIPPVNPYYDGMFRDEINPPDDYRKMFRRIPGDDRLG
jgi:arylsulfatase A-like enzyme